MIKNKTSVWVFSVISLFLLAACSGGESDKTDKGKMATPADSTLRSAPSFEVVTIKGDTVSLQQSLREDKPMVIYFTASWCPICAQNWPVLSNVYPEYKDRLNMVAISIDPTDTEQVMTKLAKKENFKFPVTRGYPNVMVDFGVKSQATTVGINRKGKIVFQRNKTALSAEQYRSLFDRLVAKQ